MNCIEIVKDRDSCEPDGDLTSRIVATALHKGLVLVTAGPTRNVIRILVPLTASLDLIDEGLDILEDSLNQVASERA